MAERNQQELSEEADDARPWAYFDANYYIAQCLERGVSPPIGSAYSQLQHYLDRGARLGLSPNSLFDEEYYLSRYPEVAEGVQLGRWASGFDHFWQVGASTDFSPTWFFDGSFYKHFHPELAEEMREDGRFSDYYAHYLLVGITRSAAAHWTIQALHTIKEYFEFPTDLAGLRAFAADGTNLPEMFGPVFSYEWMKEKYDWGRTIRPGRFMRHYLLNVKTQALSPSPYFDEPYYVTANTGVQTALDEGMFSCGYEHFVLHGMNEWRKPFATFDPRYYFDVHMPQRPAGALTLSPFAHFLRNRSRRNLSISPSLASCDIPEDMGKGLYERRCLLNAARLGDLAFAAPDGTADVSLVIITQDSFARTANCIVSAAYNTRATLEVIVFDNASHDEVSQLPVLNPTIRTLRSEENIGFTIAVNRAAACATGRMILLLNNDVELTPSAIDLALSTLEKDGSVGAVGAKIVRMHGRLQEAGSIIWRDGTCLGYGRDRDPLEGQVNFVQDVDFCSGCFLAVMRSVWEEMGGFDETYAPAYYEETDFCVRLWESGRRVVYDPRIMVWHFEYGSSAVPEEPLALMRRNQRYFVRRHAGFLAQCLPAAPAHVERARLRHVGGPRALFIEDWVPNPRQGMGFVRSCNVAQVLREVCGFLSILGLHNNVWPRGLPGGRDGACKGGDERPAEILSHVNVNNFEAFLQERVGVYDVVWLCRTHNLVRLKQWMGVCPEFFAETRIVLDTEAIAATRRYAYAQQAQLPADLTDMVLQEMEHLRGISHICVVNERDRALLVEMLARRELDIPVSVLGHALTVQKKLPRFAETHDIVLAGSYAQPDGPNADALLWFDRAVRPLLPKLPGLQFVIAGHQAEAFAKSTGLQHEYRIVNDPLDMGQVLRTARVMVAPTRFAAGVPMKVHEAASYGVPVVMTELLAAQLGWQRDGIASVPAEPAALASSLAALATDPRAWHRTQTLQADLVRKDCDPAAFEGLIRRVIGGAPANVDSIGDNVIHVDSLRNRERRRLGG